MNFRQSSPGRAHRFNVWFYLSWFFLLVYPLHHVSAQTETFPIYQWDRQYYAKIEGEQRLLYVRGFARSQMQFKDIDGDGKEDLLIGKADGRLAFFRNAGTESDPRFLLETEDFLVIHEERDANQQLLYSERIVDVGENAVPELVDIDGDGDLDLFVGSGDGQIFYYENRGNRLLPKFFRVTPIYMNLNFNGNSVPRFADLNGDRALDMVVGTKAGKVNIFFNSGLPTNALFCPAYDPLYPPDPRCRYQPVTLEDISPLGDATPALVDWDQDGDQDVVIGKSNGKLHFYWNRGTPIEPRFELLTSNFQFIDSGGFAAPVFHDLNHDGYPELFIGTTTSNIVYYENREVVFDRLKQIKSLDLTQIASTDTPSQVLEAACKQLRGLPECLIPLTQALDVPPEVKIEKVEQLISYLVRTDVSLNPAQTAETAGDETTKIKTPKLQANVKTADETATTEDEPVDETAREDKPASEQQEAGPAEPEKMITRNQLWLNTRNFLELARLNGSERHSAPTSGDWNKDGKADLMLGSQSGRIYAYTNQGEKVPDWVPLELPVLLPNQRRYSAPALGDIDGDEDLDLVVGNRQGRLELLKNEGSVEKPDWVVTDVNLAQIDVGSYSVPVLLDADRDGDLDLFVGNSRGLVIFYENQGSKQESRFILRSTRFAGAVVKGHASPAFFAWNEDENMDLVLGNREGLISLHVHLSRSVLKGWKQEAEMWQELRASGFSSPHFTDLNGDGQVDLLIGDEEGNLLLWNNGGVIKQEEITPDETVLTQNIIEEEPLAEEEEPFTEVVAEAPGIPEAAAFDPVFELVTRDYGGLRLGKRAVPAFLDTDGDGDLDLIVGNHAGQLKHFLRESGTETEQWLLETEQYLDYRGGRNAAPVFADLDGDGDKDLLVGNERGNINYWENQGDTEVPDFIPNPTPFIGVTGGRNSIPSVIDLNNDGKNDLLIGNFLGQMRYYVQKPNGEIAHFQLHLRQFLNLDVGLGAVPKVTDLNNDRLPDLVVGSDRGLLVNFQPAEGEVVNAMNWKRKEGYFEKLDLPVGGSPVFVDLDSDGDLDMVIGTEQGRLHYYRNTGR